MIVFFSFDYLIPLSFWKWFSFSASRSSPRKSRRDCLRDEWCNSREGNGTWTFCKTHIRCQVRGYAWWHCNSFLHLWFRSHMHHLQVVFYDKNSWLIWSSKNIEYKFWCYIKICIWWNYISMDAKRWTWIYSMKLKIK